MQMKTFIALVCFLTYVLSSTAYTYGSDCKSKSILDGRNGRTLIYSPYEDYTSAYNDYSSCTSLKSGDNHACCYLYVNFKNEVNGNKYTHKGCVEVSGSEWGDIKKTIENFKNNITTNYKNTTVNVKKVKIDCDSNYIKLAGLLIFALLL